MRRSALRFALQKSCPFCGKGPLYRGFLSLQPKCSSCQTSFKRFDSADGPAFFVNALLCIIAGTMSLIIETNGGAPFWVHALLWLVVVFGLTAVLLRPVKSLMIGLQAKYDAREVHLDKN